MNDVILSRIAEALTWTGRYVERADNTGRILDAYLHRLLEDPSNPARHWLGTALAGVDLINATQSLRGAAKGGNLGVLFSALGAAGATLRQLHSPEAETGQAAPDPGEVSQRGTDLMRQLEGMLRSLARGEDRG